MKSLSPPMSREPNSMSSMEYDLRIGHDARYFARLILQLVVGLIAALSLAWFMHYLIQSSDLRLAQADRMQMLDFVRIKREETINRKRRAPDRPQLSKTPEVPPVRSGQVATGGPQLSVSTLPGISDIKISPGGIGFGAGAGADEVGATVAAEGDYLPIVKVAPIYPHAAYIKGIQGECVVSYTVTKAGTVKDVEVVREECDNVMFHRSSIEAAKRFKYKPRVIDGVPIEVTGIRNKFYYNVVDKRR